MLRTVVFHYLLITDLLYFSHMFLHKTESYVNLFFSVFPVKTKEEEFLFFKLSNTVSNFKFSVIFPWTEKQV